MLVRGVGVTRATGLARASAGEVLTAAAVYFLPGGGAGSRVDNVSASDDQRPFPQVPPQKESLGILPQ